MKRNLFARRFAIALAMAAGAFVLSWVGSPRLRAQTRVTLASLQDEIDSILEGNSATGRHAFVTGTDTQTLSGVGDPGDNRIIPGRSLTFVKQSDTSTLRIHYSEQFQFNFNSAGSLIWSINFSGGTNLLTSFPLAARSYDSGGPTVSTVPFPADLTTLFSGPAGTWTFGVSYFGPDPGSQGPGLSFKASPPLPTFLESPVANRRQWILWVEELP